MVKSLPVLLLGLALLPGRVWAGGEKGLSVEKFDGTGPKLGNS